MRRTGSKKRRLWPWLLGGFVLYGVIADDDKASPRATAPVSLNNPVVEKDRTRQADPQTIVETMYVDASRLNVREGPSKNTKQVWTLKRDEKVSVVGRNGKWAKVSSERYSGWVFSTYLTSRPGQKMPTEQPRPTTTTSLSTAQIKRILIERSQSYYRGNCPCPYSRMRNGRRCGGNSAYSRPGGAEPLCYDGDVSNDMVAQYRSRL